MVNARQYSIVKDHNTEVLGVRFQVLEVSDTWHLKPGTFFMVGLGRVELPTSPLSGVRSSHLSYRPAMSYRLLVELVGIEPATS